MIFGDQDGPGTELEEARRYLIWCQGLSGEEQLQHLNRIEAAFRVFWASAPDEDVFVGHMDRMILSARMLYWMVRSSSPEPGRP